MTNYQKEQQMIRNELVDLLTQQEIPLESWGMNGAKTVDHLLDELNEGETLLVEDGKTGRLIREFSFLAIVVLHKDKNDTYQLIEEKQIFSDGSQRVRLSEISVGEKIKYGIENVGEAITRALEEELGIKKGFNVLKKDEVLVEEVDSKSYPGLKSHRNRYNVVVEIDSSEYKPEGYMEVQKDKTTYFVWNKVTL
jgi:hypothetical protein